MDFTEHMNEAVEYIESHLKEKISIDELARLTHYSRYHFQRVFGATFGITVGEYIRKRRLSLAGRAIAAGKKVIDVALEFCYESPESFQRAFLRFHGVNPSEGKGAKLRSFERISFPNFIQGEKIMNVQIKKCNRLILTGYKAHFSGVPFGAEREAQENEFFSSTRAAQWLLIGACKLRARNRDFGVITNVTDDGYDFSIAYELDEWTRRALCDVSVTGFDLSGFGFKTIEVPSGEYAVFETERQDKFYPISSYTALRRAIAEELPARGFYLKDAPELVIYHGRSEKRSIEIRMPCVRHSKN